MEGLPWTEDQQQHSSSLQFGQSRGEAARRHSSGEHPHSAHCAFIACARRWLGSLTPLLAFENHDHQDNEHDNEKPSPDVDEGHPEQGDHTQANHPKDILPSYRQGANAAPAGGLRFIFSPTGRQVGHSFRHQAEAAQARGRAERPAAGCVANIPDAHWVHQEDDQFRCDPVTTERAETGAMRWLCG